ncbi:MAG TPA: Ig-like domain-containing protein [Polyangiaceae bacterium]
MSTNAMAVWAKVRALVVLCLLLLAAVAGSNGCAAGQPTVVSLDVTRPTASIPAGVQQVFQATVTYADGTTRTLTSGVTWKSSDPSVADVDATGLATGRGAGTATITAVDASSQAKGVATLRVTSATLVSVAVTPATKKIPAGTSFAFKATGTFSDGTTAPLTTGLAWTSSTPSVATVAGDGTATGVAVGTSTITATDTASGHAGSATLTVSAATLSSLAITPASPTAPVGTTEALHATGTYSDGSTLDLTTAVTWSSTATAVATVSNVSGTEGVATAVVAGTTSIGCTYKGKSAATLLTVNSAVMEDMVVTPFAPGAPLGGTQQMLATGTYSDHSQRDVSTLVTWTSSATGVATVSNATGSQGLVSAAGIGLTTITATDPATHVSGAVSFQVSGALLRAIAITPSPSSVTPGLSEQLTATGTYADGTTRDLTATVTWSSSAPATLAVSNAAGSNGQATGLATGQAVVTATDPSSGVSAATTVTVQDCATYVAQHILNQPISPPNLYGGFDLGNGSPGGSLTVDQANAAGCFAFVEPQTFTPPAAPSLPGERLATLGGTNGIQAYYTLDSRALFQLTYGSAYSGTISFHSRVGGAFGTHTYVVGLAASGAALVQRDGAGFPADWNTPGGQASPWGNEIFDGLMATFSPDYRPGTDCKTALTCLFLPDDGLGDSILGVRPLGFYMEFTAGTNQTRFFYNFWVPAGPTCATPDATSEADDYAPIAPADTPGIGRLQLGPGKAKQITWQEANGQDCNGATVTAPDPGYGAIAWGPGHEVELEYNSTTSLGTKLVAQTGYRGTLSVTSADGTSVYVVAVGNQLDASGVSIGTAITKAPASNPSATAPFTLSWTDPNLASITELSNAIDATYSAYFGGDDVNCSTAGNCTVTADDGQGHSVLTLPNTSTTGSGTAPLTFVFAQGTSTTQEIVASWPPTH